MNLDSYKATGDKKLSEYATIPDQALGKKEAKKALKKSRKELADFQERMYAHDKHAVLVCFQGMDTFRKRRPDSRGF